jgi:amino acid permease
VSNSFKGVGGQLIYVHTVINMLPNRPHRYEELNASSCGPDDLTEIVEVVNLSPVHQGSTDRTVVNQLTLKKKGTILSGYFNIANTILGSSVLGLPYAYGHTGWLLGTVLLVVCGASSAFALHTLSLCAIRLNKEKHTRTGRARAVSGASFYSVGMATLPSLTLVIDVAIALKCFGVAISYLIVTGDLMPLVMQQIGASEAWTKREVWVFLGWLSVAPLTMLKNLNSLAPVSSLAIAFVLFFALLVVLYAANIDGLDPCGSVPADETCKGPTYAVKVDFHTCKVFPIFVFGFTCHQVHPKACLYLVEHRRCVLHCVR